MPCIPLTIEEIRILRYIQVCLSEQETWEPDTESVAWQEYDEEDTPSTPLMHHFDGMGKKAVIRLVPILAADALPAKQILLTAQEHEEKT